MKKTKLLLLEFGAWDFIYTNTRGSKWGQIYLLREVRPLLRSMPNLVELDFRSDSRCKDLFGHLLHDTILALEQLQVFRARPHFDGGAPDYWPELGVFVPPTSWGPREDGACLEWGFRRPCTFALQDFQWRLNNATLRTMSLTFVATMDQSSGLPRWRPVILQPNTVELRRLELWRCQLRSGGWLRTTRRQRCDAPRRPIAVLLF